MNAFAAAIAAAVEQAPMSNGEQGVRKGRLLCADGDGLAYYCAGNDDTAPGEARSNLLNKLRSAQQASGAEEIKIVTTSAGSHKGFRYAVARAKPYQGQRTTGRRPKNWEYLRDYLSAGAPGSGFDVEFTAIAEADDLFSRYALHHPDCVIYTQDKDMRMVPGWHLEWLTHIMFRLDANAFRAEHGDKVWGRAWFWQQMLQGDTADNIPGLPFYREGGKDKRIGEVGATKALAKVESDMGALLVCQQLYRSYYEDRWLVEMLEQGILLWMRNDTMSSPLNVTAVGNPLHSITTHELWPAARAEIMARIAEALVHAETEGVGSGASETEPVAGPTDALCALPAPVLGDGCGAGPRSLNGAGAGCDSPGVQQPAGQGREQPQALRREVPAGFPAWGSRLLAAPRD